MKKPFKTTLTQEQMTLVQTLADHDLNILAAGRALHMSKSSVYYHAKKIKNQTGLDPHNFYDLHELLYLEIREDVPDDDLDEGI